MKKMAIVPVRLLEEMNRWKNEQRPRLPPSPQVAQTSSLQKEMNSVLENEQISESEKAQRYGQALHQFQVSHKKAIGPVEEYGEQSTEEPKPITMKDQIMDSVPHTMRRKATLLLNMIKDHPNLRWDEHGVLEYEGKPIPGSNIIDLVNDVLRQRKGSNPRGWEQFSRGLKEVNVPQEVVGNKHRWNWIHKYDDEEEEDEFHDSFAYIPPSSPKKTKSIPKKTTIKLEPAKWDAF